MTAMEGQASLDALKVVCRIWEIAALIVKPLILRAVGVPIDPTP